VNRHGFLVGAGYVLEAVRLWPNRTMRDQRPREGMPGSESSCPSHDGEESVVRTPSPRSRAGGRVTGLMTIVA
jgi:hypothetical protein